VSSPEKPENFYNLQEILSALFAIPDYKILLARVRAVDISNSFLLSGDIPKLCEMLKMLPNVETLCLYNNYLLDDIDIPALITAADKLRYIVIHNTPIVSCEGVDVFARFSESNLERLVFIETVDELKSKSWHYLFPNLNATCFNLICKVHNAYFEDTVESSHALKKLFKVTIHFSSGAAAPCAFLDPKQKLPPSALGSTQLPVDI
jgi:hypothetical protein